MLNRLKSRGLLYSLGIVFNRVVPERIFRFRIFRIFEIGLPTEKAIEIPAPDGITFRWCETDEDFAQARSLTYFQSESGGEGPESPKRACLAIDTDEPMGTQTIGGVWIGDDYFDETELGVRILLTENQSWIFAAMVAKAHRRRRIYRRLLWHVVASQKQTLFASINPTNKASIAAHAPFIRRTAGTCIVLRILGRTFCRVGGSLSIKGNEITI
ncbi:hypothetical protein Poly51_03140 [Rubripirellula tenax]|uniref:N-acetyltransferase domain-containing protein n=1 Tax=Rubripirellula tenax TaxID=2528015 RepID=A0A5C6FGR9_9BACT|nr:hypothetical protein [Rubripirellula tenax]TWU60040.1 hypothetical protein Poly51_03140 [Rubripirellula tenax]